MKHLKYCKRSITTCIFTLLFCLGALHVNAEVNTRVFELASNAQNASSLALKVRVNQNLKRMYLSWDSCMPSHVVYEVHKSIDSGKTWVVLCEKKGSEPTKADGKYEFVDPVLAPCVYYKVKVKDSAADELCTDMAKIDASINYPSLLKSFQSKPVQGNFSFVLKSSTEYAVFNAEGTRLKSGLAAGEVVVSGLGTGVYFLDIIGAKNIETYKVLIQ